MKKSAAKAEARADASTVSDDARVHSTSSASTGMTTNMVGHEHDSDGPQASSHDVYMAKLDSIRAKCAGRRDSSGTPARVGAAKLVPRRDEY